MPPRISASVTGSSLNMTSLLQALPYTLSKHPEYLTRCSACLFSTTFNLQMKRKGKKRHNERKDPYRLAQALQRKTANLGKRKVLQAEREAALGDPVRSKPTPFMASLDLASNPAGATTQTGEQYLNYYLKPADMSEQLRHSKWLTEPLEKEDAPSVLRDEKALQKRRKEWNSEHKTAEQAIANITDLANSNSGDRKRINIQRCIETFGRHTTDTILAPKPASQGPSHSTPTLDADEAPTPEQTRRAELMAELAAVPKRAGPDTGSSEVQVAILTTKINVMARDLHKKDKHNKANLRLLVHKRQKLLNYLRKKERGGPRWQNLVDQLGVNDAMWKGEISL
ncbi:hypothetical protein LTR70_003602 [Exophiala xenobiotica]|uniref:Ribosomal protein S15 n=1 Tax=Lithohypha guttulata TaxID=1690604 RepID=A0ABR0KFR3_9EURO|nr:hypothetical protein LTR24_003207 [Lithohypha guttulata]KAK5322815.1 hypothetical protein LTR70_003602 [Exophiala xenobiotica]